MPRRSKRSRGSPARGERPKQVCPRRRAGGLATWRGARLRPPRAPPRASHDRRSASNASAWRRRENTTRAGGSGEVCKSHGVPPPRAQRRAYAHSAALGTNARCAVRARARSCGRQRSRRAAWAVGMRREQCARERDARSLRASAPGTRPLCVVPCLRVVVFLKHQFFVVVVALPPSPARGREGDDAAARPRGA